MPYQRETPGLKYCTNIVLSYLQIIIHIGLRLAKL